MPFVIEGIFHMNIFVTDECPVKSAQNLCDKHVVKMVVETAQILSTVCHANSQTGRHLDKLYRPTHRKHPCVVWAGHARGNYSWVYAHFIALCDEYTFRYSKTHKSQPLISEFEFQRHYGLSFEDHFGCGFIAVMKQNPECIVPNDPIESYRNYYRTVKAPICKWEKGRAAPEWFTQ